jgi:hypothetical protein
VVGAGKAGGVNKVDSVNHWDLPVAGKPREVMVRVAERDKLAEPSDDVEVWIVSREPVQVFDFYRHRPDRAEAIRRYA